MTEHEREQRVNLLVLCLYHLDRTYPAHKCVSYNLHDDYSVLLV